MVRAAAKRLLDFLLSIKTTVVLMLGLIIFFVAGALIMPLHPAFESINSVPLLEWLAEAPAGGTWWLLGTIVLLAVLAANTVACSAESLMRKRSGRQWLLVVSPQVIHIGFMLMLLGHLVSAYGSFKGTMVAVEGSRARLPNGVTLKVSRLDVKLTPSGFPTDWRADVVYLKDGETLKTDYSAPNRPSFHGGYGVYVKQVRPFPMRAALIEVTREPGAPWALGGGAVFMLGTIALVALKMSREQ
jgi:cytochrome c biogenesis protein ResB